MPFKGAIHTSVIVVLIEIAHTEKSIWAYRTPGKVRKRETAVVDGGSNLWPNILAADILLVQGST